MPTLVPTPGLSAIISRFHGLIIDQGVIHDGAALYPGALDALGQLRSAGIRTLVLAVSNQSDKANAAHLERLGVDPDLYERVVSTGQLLRHALVAQSLNDKDADRRYLVLAAPEDAALLDDTRLKRAASVADADAVILLTPDDPAGLAALEAAAERRLPLYAPSAQIRALPPEGERAPGFAAALQLYRTRGGEIFLFGKPSGRVYARCLNLLYPIETGRIAAIGNQFPADIVGARTMGIEPIFVGTGAGGLADESATAREDWQAELTRLCHAAAISDLMIMPRLAW